MSVFTSKINVYLIFLAAFGLAALVLHRWMVADLGMLSYGRVWQLYVSYFDVGFSRRALIGTVFSITSINRIFDNEYVFALFVHSIAILILAASLAFYCASNSIKDWVFLVGVALSPALLLHSGYGTGSLDIFVLLLASFNILYVRNVLLFSLIIALGVMTHELFLFTIPAQYLAWRIRNSKDQDRIANLWLSLPFLTAIISVGVIYFFGSIDLSRTDYELVMENRLPNAAGQHGLWSGYFELASTTDENASTSLQILLVEVRQGFLYLLLPLIYVALLCIRLFDLSSDRRVGILCVSASLFPLLVAFLATDYYRWIAMSSNMAILLTLVFVAQQRSAGSRWNTALLAFCLLAPFGSAEIERPFPMHQFALERLLN